MPLQCIFVQKKCKNAISDHQNGHHFPRSRSFQVKSRTTCPLPLATSLPSFIGITTIDLKKRAKMWFHTVKWPSFPKVKFTDNVILTPSKSRPCFVGITKIDWEKSAKAWFFYLKWPPQKFSPHFTLHSRTTHDMCEQDIMWISPKLRALGPGQTFDNTLWILLLQRWRWLQTNQTHIGPTLYVWPNYG